ncbi:MAG: hypothetical protein GWO39_08035, partial [Gammaproteobacteria bacterium]|nr:hypothetical protein [Gammaproteobacteria bacterium]NIT63726.1 hypothetical protein [Gammaproteobacteria bacterium]NIV20682.1 hypothetical protein [Gammaproteobacteria bacterium]NIY32306.1 hypothetical protein [Gammaproteobacteria bacterium]
PAGTEKENQPFGEISIQAAFHDLLSDDRAFAPNSHISLLHLRGRFEDRDDGRADSWQLERFALLDVVSLFPVTQLSSQPSWHLDLSWNRVRDGACAD